MKCPSCEHEYLVNARFCENCGTGLYQNCGLCGNTLSPGARYCQSCGTVTASGRQAMPSPYSSISGENRQISVVFSDLVDSTRLSQQLDPEAYRDLIQSYQQAAAAVVDHYQGYIARYLGDGILIYFGFPTAHDDDAERAVNAGYDIVAAIEKLNKERLLREEPALAVRLGIHTGPAVVSEIGDPRNSNVQVLGDTINIASRVQEHAPHNTVAITQATLRLVPGQFITESLGDRQLKGVSAPVKLHQIKQRSGVRSRLEAAVHLTSLVGREPQLGKILEAWRNATTGQGSAILVSGEAGLGKSRVLHAFHERITDTPHTWLECRCTQLDQATAFKPVVELLRRSLRLAETADNASKLTGLENAIENVGGDPAVWVPLMAPLLGMDIPKQYAAPNIGGDQKRKRTVEILVQWLLALGERQGLVVLIEDVHWCDHSTLELLDKLVCESHNSRLLFLISQRPSHPLKLTCNDKLQEITLAPLTGTEVTLMVDALSPARMPDEVKKLICERAGGVPLFVEELTKAVLESETLERKNGGFELVEALEALATAIPSSLQDLLMSRLDMLGSAKQLAQIGAVIGREFHYQLISALSDQPAEALHADLKCLIDAELVYQRGNPPNAVYLFKHALVQDTAYQALLRSSRRKLHGRIAEAQSSLLKQRIINDPGQVAWHFEQAGKIEEAAAYYKKAAILAERRSAIKEAYEISRHAFDLLVDLPYSSEQQQQRMEIMISLGRAIIALKGYAHKEAGEVTRMGVELAGKIGHPLYASLSMSGLCVHHLYRAEFQSCEATAHCLIENSAKYEMPFFNIMGLYHLGCSKLYQGAFSEALHFFDQTLDLFTPALAKASVQMVGQDLYTNTLALKVWPAWLQGNAAEAIRMNASAIEAAREGDSPMTLCHVLCQTARLQQMQGDYEAMLTSAREALDIADCYSLAVWREVARITSGAALCALGKSNEGLPDMSTGIEALVAMGTRGLCPFYLGLYAEANLRAGNHRACERALDDALLLANGTGGHIWTAELLRLKGDWVIQTGGSRTDAMELWRQAETVAQTQQAATLSQRITTRIRRVELAQLKRSTVVAISGQHSA